MKIIRRASTPALLALLASPAVAAPVRGGDEWVMPWHGYGHMMFGGLMMLAFWVLLILAVVLVVRWLMGTPGHAPGAPRTSSAVHILEERYARGEFDREEFEERKRHLSS